MGREFELKYAATPAIQAALRAQFGPWTEISMETTYFDTPDGALSAHRMTLRLRKENGITVCTLKTPLPDGSRGEWECPAESIDDGIRTLIALGAPKLVAGLTIQGIFPCCGAKFTRLAAQVPTADGMAELALDQGILLGGSKELPLCEVEVELKSGSEAAATALAQALAAAYSLSEEPKSKFRRAMDLAQGE
ncbi:MAG: CYTH domain-containing protein [Ruminococcaceae bacterium]|nr:CYTH domain-containing protein [Oscillospiraceae bacterium]